MGSDKLGALALLLILLAIGAGRVSYELGHEATRGPAGVSARSAQAEEVVNKHLALTNSQILISQERARIEAKALPQVGDRIWPSKKFKIDHDVSGELDLSSGRQEENVNNDLNRHPREYGLYKSPDAIIQNQNFQNDQIRDIAGAYIDEYVRQFVENARQQGYEVRVNEDFVVTSVKKINKRGFNVLNPQSSGER